MNLSITTKKYTNFTPKEIEKYIENIKDLIIEGKYTISKNEYRQENIDFIESYRIDSKKEKSILLNLNYNDFCYAVDNTKKEFAHEKLYVFCKEYELDNWGDLEKVKIYIKINITETRKDEEIMIVVSFHKVNKPIKYLFK